MNGEQLRLWAEEMLADDNPEALFMDGLDEAIVGVGRQFTKPSLVVYDYDLIVKVLGADGIDPDDIVEYVEFNIVGAWVGESTPFIIHRPDEPD